MYNHKGVIMYGNQMYNSPMGNQFQPQGSAVQHGIAIPMGNKFIMFASDKDTVVVARDSIDSITITEVCNGEGGNKYLAIRTRGGGELGLYINYIGKGEDHNLTRIKISKFIIGLIKDGIDEIFLTNEVLTQYIG